MLSYRTELGLLNIGFLQLSALGEQMEVYFPNMG